MDTNAKEFEELLVSRVTDRIEAGVSEQESKRFRNLYIIIGFVSFIGFGVISQLVDFYATRAVESKLEEAKQELDSAKVFSQLLALATKLDISDSFTRTDRDTIVALLVKAESNKKLRAEPAFLSLLEKIIDSFYASDNPAHLSRIVGMYGDECIQNPDIALTLLQHYGRAYLAETNLDEKPAVDNLINLQTYIRALSGGEAKGAAAGFQVLAEFKKNNLTRSKQIDDLLSSLKALDRSDKKHFATVILVTTSPDRMSKKLTPEVLRIANVANKFMNAYKSELTPLLSNVATELENQG